MHPIPELEERRLYVLLEAAAGQARASARALARGAEEGTLNPATLVEPVRTSAKAAGDIRAHLLRANMVSLPKADLEALVSVLTEIPRDAARFAERFGLAVKVLGDLELRPALTWIEELSEVLFDMVRQLRGFESLNRLKELNARLQKVADCAEAPTDEIVAQVYRRSAQTLDIMSAKDMSDQLGGIIERYREAGRIMEKISFEFF
jgi:uncharacterized protein